MGETEPDPGITSSTSKETERNKDSTMDETEPRIISSPKEKVEKKEKAEKKGKQKMKERDDNDDSDVILSDMRKQLQDLKALYDDGLITKKIYEQRQLQILEGSQTPKETVLEGEVKQLKLNMQQLQKKRRRRIRKAMKMKNKIPNHRDKNLNNVEQKNSFGEICFLPFPWRPSFSLFLDGSSSQPMSSENGANQLLLSSDQYYSPSPSAFGGSSASGWRSDRERDREGDSEVSSLRRRKNSNERWSKKDNPPESTESG